MLGTIPISVLGLAFKDQIENEVRSLELISTVMIVFSLVLWQADRAGSARARGRADQRRATASIIGFAQALALVPGVSRSGATISFGLFQGLDARGRRALQLPALGARGRAVRAVRAPARR